MAALLAMDSCMLTHGEPVRAVAEVPGTAEHSVQVGELERSFLLHVPSARPRRLGRVLAYPLVIVLHGSGASGETVRRMSGMDGLADSAHFVVAYPNGSTGRLNMRSDWNAGVCCGPAESRKVDDVAFIRTLLDSIAAKLPIDRNRVYVAGFSDGGRMTYRVACELSTSIAAIAVVAGSVVDTACAPRRPVPLIAFHGTADHDVPYDDSSYTTPRTTPMAATLDLPPSIRFWSANNGCKAVTIRRTSAHVAFVHFDRCAAEVSFYSIDDGLHAWPGGDSDGQEPTHELNASSAVWRFFQLHALR